MISTLRINLLLIQQIPIRPAVKGSNCMVLVQFDDGHLQSSPVGTCYSDLQITAKNYLGVC